MSYTFDQSIDELNIALGDTSNVTFTIEEKQRAMKKAWRDAHVVNRVRDDSLTYSSATSEYTVPSTVTTVRDINIIIDASLPEQPLDADLYTVESGKIRFNQHAQNSLPDNATLVIYGNYKITISDSITSDKMLEYVVAVAGVETLTLLGFKKANLFLKNDTTMGELITLRREFKQDIKEFRAMLPKQYESA